jgi:hypothetical protein
MIYDIGDLTLEPVKEGRRYYIEWGARSFSSTKDRWVAFVRRHAPKDEVGRYFTTERAAIAAIKAFQAKEHHD